MVDRQVYRQIYLSSSTRFHQCHHYFDRRVPRYWIGAWEKDVHAFYKHKWRMAQRRKRQRWGVNVGLNRPHGSEGLADPYFLNGRELAIEAQRAVSLGDRNPKFWRQVIERARVLRDVTSVADLCVLLDSVVAVNVRHTDLMQLLSREFIDDIHKVHGDELASILGAYAHFQCKSDSLLAAAARQLKVLLDDGIPASSLAVILGAFHKLDFALDPELLVRCRSLCHQYAWEEPAFSSLDEVVMAYDAIDPIPMHDQRNLPSWSANGSLQSAASLLLMQGHNAAIAKPLVKKLLQIETPARAQPLPSTVAAFATREVNPLVPHWDYEQTPAGSSTMEDDAEFEVQADWDDKESTSAPAPKIAYHFQWYNHITRQVKAEKPVGYSYFDPQAVRQRHVAGRIVGSACRAFALHHSSLEQDDELRQLVQDFIHKTLEVVPVIAKNLHPEDLIAITTMWTDHRVRDPEAWHPISLELIRKFVRFDGAAIEAIRAAIRSWPEIPHAPLLNTSIKRWGLRKIITDKKRCSD